tara:strand:- start:161 stop:364 length:204 start_codon:yes stop_codon:yes gene_type:complete
LTNQWNIIKSGIGYQVLESNVRKRALYFNNLPDAQTTLELINFRLELDKLKKENKNASSLSNLDEYK